MRVSACGQAFVALLGDEAPAVGKTLHRSDLKWSGPMCKAESSTTLP